MEPTTHQPYFEGLATTLMYYVAACSKAVDTRGNVVTGTHACLLLRTVGLESMVCALYNISPCSPVHTRRVFLDWACKQFNSAR